MELKKYQASKVTYQIRHNLRCLPDGKSYGNESIVPELTPNNYSLIDRGKTAKEVMKYRRDFEKKVFRYNRKNIVRAVELIIQCPSDCPPEQHKAFFQTSFDWYCDNFLPAKKDCVLTAEVHRDERHHTPTGEMISKEHLHILYVPAVEDKKHEGFPYRLCADELTRRAVLNKMHPSLQKELNDRGIQATVYRKKASDGKSIALSTSQLKEITKLTGVTVDGSLTVDDLAKIISENIKLRSIEATRTADITADKARALQSDMEQLKIELSRSETLRESLSSALTKKDETIRHLQEKIIQKDRSAEILQKNFLAEKTLSGKIEEKFAAEQIRNRQLEKQLKQAEKEIENLKNKKVKITQDKDWGASPEWGSSRSTWGNKNITQEVEKTW